MSIPPLISRRLHQYCADRGVSAIEHLGQGKDGSVWSTDRDSAVKIHESASSYNPELAAYIRLIDRQLTHIAGFSIPELLDFEDDLFAIEMTIVYPPYLLDFASAIIDRPSDLIEDAGNTLADLVHSRFGDRAPEIIFLQQQLATRAGIHITDLHAHNIKFPPPTK